MKANTWAIIQSFVLPSQKLKKTAEEAEAQYKSEYFLSLDDVYYYTCDQTLANNSYHGSQQPITLILVCIPGQIETLTDLLLEDFKSFRTCQELGEESANFIRHELKTTWGSSHLAVLDEQEAQKWLLGVGTCFYLALHPNLG